MMAEIDVVYRLFEARQLHISRPWLESCISWCKEELLPSNYTTKDLQVKVFEQWLLLDFRDIEVPSLPPSLSQKEKFTLNGNYSLQLMYVIDISKPKYWQLQRIRNESLKNVENDVQQSKRMLLLRLSDGVQEIDAMEYKPIHVLNLNLKPGCKLRLIGPLLIRRGKIILKSDNVNVYGGEVEDLLVTNACENIMAKHFNFPLNNNPNVIHENAETNVTPNKDNEVEVNVAINRNNRQSQLGTLEQVTLVAQRNAENRISRLPINEYPKTTFEDEINEEVNNMMEIERDLEREKTKELATKSPDVFDDDIDFDDIEMPPTVIKTPEQSQRQHEHNIIHSSQSGFAINTNVHNKSDLSLWTIERINQNKSKTVNGLIRLKAKFKSVIERITILEDKFRLVVSIEDDTGELPVIIHSDVVSNLAKCSPNVFIDVKDKDRRTPEIEAKVLSALTCLKNALVALDNIMEIQVSSNENYPTVLMDQYTLLNFKCEESSPYEF